MVYMQKEWEPQEGKMPALSIQQPFAMAIIQGVKKIELRNWGTHYRGPIALHAGKKWYGGITFPGYASDWQLEPIKQFVRKYQLPAIVGDYPVGAIIGVARLVKCATFSREGYEKLRDQHCSDCAWTPSEFGWLFEDVQPLAEPIRNVRGYLGLFPVDEIVIEQIAKG